MLRALLSLSVGTGAASTVAAGSLMAIQNTVVTPESLVSGTFAVQIALLVTFLISAGGMLIYAGRIIGQWQTAQKQLIRDVKENDEATLQLRERVGHLEGTVKMMSMRTRSRLDEGQGGRAV